MNASTSAVSARTLIGKGSLIGENAVAVYTATSVWLVLRLPVHTHAAQCDGYYTCTGHGVTGEKGDSSKHKIQLSRVGGWGMKQVITS